MNDFNNEEKKAGLLTINHWADILGNTTGRGKTMIGADGYIIKLHQSSKKKNKKVASNFVHCIWYFGYQYFVYEFQSFVFSSLCSISYLLKKKKQN